MSRYSPAKRAKELRRKAKHEAKEVRKKERRENAGVPGAPISDADDPDIDWSQAVGMPRPEGADEGAQEGTADAPAEEGEQ